MNGVYDPVMDEIYSIRHELSTSCGHDAAAYFEDVKNEKLLAQKIGISYFDYCFSQLERKE